MAVPRANWKGYLKLSLVSCPIALYPAISAAERVSFRQVNRKTGNRLRQQMVDSVTGEVVQSHDKGRGYEIGERQFLLVGDEELEAAQLDARRKPQVSAATAERSPERGPSVDQGAPAQRIHGNLRSSSEELRRGEPKRPPAQYVEAREEPPPSPPIRVENNRTIEIERFVPLAQIDPRYHDTPYYIAPRDEVGEEAFAVIREAMDSEDMVGMGRVVLANRERPIILRPLGKGLMGMTLRYAHEVRDEAEYFAHIPELELPQEMLQVARHIMEIKTGDFDPAYLEDRYRTALVSMLKEKQRELPQKVAPVAPSQRNVINLMDALKRSLETERPPAASVRKPTPRRSGAAPKPTSKRTTRLR